MIENSAPDPEDTQPFVVEAVKSADDTQPNLSTQLKPPEPGLIDPLEAPTQTNLPVMPKIVRIDNQGQPWYEPDKGEDPEVPPEPLVSPSPADDEWITPEVPNNTPPNLDEDTQQLEPFQVHPAVNEDTLHSINVPEYIPPGGKVESTPYSLRYTGQLTANKVMLIGRDTLRDPNQVNDQYAIGLNAELAPISRDQLQVSWRTGGLLPDGRPAENKILIQDNRQVDKSTDPNQQVTKLNGIDITQLSDTSWQELKRGDTLELNGIWFDVQECDPKTGVIRLEKVEMAKALPHILGQEKFSQQVDGWEDLNLVDDNWLVKFDQVKGQRGNELVHIAVFVGLMAELWKKWVTNPAQDAENQKPVLALLSGEKLKDDLTIIFQRIGQQPKIKGVNLKDELLTAIKTKNPTVDQS